MLCTSVGVAGAAAPPNYPQTGRITYKMSVSALTGTNVISWINGGKQYRQEISLSGSVPGQGSAVTSLDTWMINDGKNFYVHQPLMGMKVAKVKMPKPGAKKAGAPGAPGAALLGAATSGGKVVGKETILGKPCEIRQAGQAKIWSWHGLALKFEMTGAGQVPAMTMVATKLETALKLSPDLFKLPAGYEVTDNPLEGMPGAGGTPTIRKGTQ